MNQHMGQGYILLLDDKLHLERVNHPFVHWFCPADLRVKGSEGEGPRIEEFGNKNSVCFLSLGFVTT